MPRSTTRSSSGKSSRAPLRQSGHPGRTVVFFFLSIVVLFGLVALGGQWKPALGLDLQGGTRVTLIAKGNPSSANLQEAADIIDARVNGSGVSEAEVTTQGSKVIVVEIPGDTNNSLLNLVSKPAQLRFRLVALQSSGASTAVPTPTATSTPGSGVLAPSSSASASASTTKKAGQGKATTSATKGATKTASQSPSSSPRGRTVPGFADTQASSSASPSDGASPGDTASPSGTASAGDTASPSGSASPSADSTTPAAPNSTARINQALAFQTTPSAAASTTYTSYTCPTSGAPQVDDDPDQPLVTCDADGQKYLLSDAIIEGTQVQDASFGIPQNDTQYVVTLDLDGDATKTLATVSQKLVGDQSKTFAITLDGQVISSAYFSAAINDGNPQISGNFTQASASSLATSLRYGSLPIAFEPNPTNEEIGPSLAGSQLSAGITAGVIGLALVMLYCLLYYRGLGIVVVASLVVAGLITYALVLLLSKTAGFTLTLPGIAGLIVAVGITADSFIVYFERIRDEMRDGRSMRVAVEAGWKRARATCVAADAVSLLAAVVLYIFAAGVVKGFAFALGLSTLIDLAVFFWFTKPMVTWLGGFRFFNQGHKLSGLDAENIGVDHLPGLRAGGRA